MFELKNIYLIKKLRDFEFGQKKNLLQLKVSSFFKKDQLKDGRDYIFSFKSKSELNSWIITLNLLRAKSIYDEFRNTFGVINFPFNHEKIGKEDKRKIKKPFVMPEICQYKRKKKSVNFYLLKTKIINKSKIFNLNKDNCNDKQGNEAEALFEEQKAAIETEYTIKMKERVECLLMVTFGYFMGIIQKNISFNMSDCYYKFSLGKPTHLIEAIKNSKNYKKMIEEQEKSKNETNKIKRSNISSTNKKIQISGGSVISGFAPEVNNIKEEDSSNKFLTNNGNNINDINQINNSQNNEKYLQNNEKFSLNNEKYSQNNEKYSHNNENYSHNNEKFSNDKNNINNNNGVVSQKNYSIISSSKKNSGKDDIIFNNISNLRKNTNNNENNHLSYQLKLSHETGDKSEDRIYETDKKRKKKSSFASDNEMEAKDKLKSLKIEINSKKLEEQIRQLLLEKQHL